MIVRRALIVALASVPVRWAIAAEGGPTEPVVALNDGLKSVMHAGRATPFADRAASLTPVVQRAFSLPTVLQASVGPRYTSLPADQQADLLTVFTQYTVASYVANFDADSGDRFVVNPETRTVGGDQVVSSLIVPRGGAQTKLDYQVRQGGAGWQIVDVLIDGSISQVAVQRSDFRSLLSSGSAMKLIESLRRKTASLASGGKG